MKKKSIIIILIIILICLIGGLFYFNSKEKTKKEQQSKEIVKDLTGKWTTYRAIDASTGKEFYSLEEVFGSSYLQYGSYLELKEDKTFIDRIHPVTTKEMKGTYKILNDYYEIGDTYIELTYEDNQKVLLQKVDYETNEALTFLDEETNYQYDLKLSE